MNVNKISSWKLISNRYWRLMMLKQFCFVNNAGTSHIGVNYRRNAYNLLFPKEVIRLRQRCGFIFITIQAKPWSTWSITSFKSPILFGRGKSRSENSCIGVNIWPINGLVLKFPLHNWRFVWLNHIRKQGDPWTWRLMCC